MKNLPVIPYALTFKGVIAYGSQVILETPDQIHFDKRSPEEFQKDYRRAYRTLLKEEESLIEFFENNGKRLKYPIFSEIRWIINIFNKTLVLDTIQRVGKDIANSSIVSSKKRLQNYRKQLKDLKKQKATLKKNPFLQKLTVWTSFGGGTKKESEFDVMESVNEKLSFVERIMQTFTQTEEKMIQQRFAFMFFHQIAFYTRFAKENAENNKLCQFAEQLLNLKLENEIIPLKKVISVFNGGKEC